MALLLTEPALGHVDLRPRLVVQGVETVLRIELPQLRPGPAPVRLEVDGDGVVVLASDLKEVAGVETRWSVRLRVSAAVDVDAGITVVPPAEQGASGSFLRVGVAAGVVVALGLAAAELIFARRRGAW